MIFQNLNAFSELHRHKQEKKLQGNIIKTLQKEKKGSI